MSDPMGEAAGLTPVTCVHLEAGPDGFDSEEVRRSWQARGYATLPEYEGHPVGVRCGVCSTDQPKAQAQS